VASATRIGADAVPTDRDSVYYALGSAWHRSELGSALEIGPVSVIGELDPTGANGVLLEVLCLFAKSLDPLLALLDEHRARGSSVGIKFEAHKLGSAAAQTGALRLAAACMEVTRHFASGDGLSAPSKLDPLSSGHEARTSSPSPP
jgi:HPt (histidine-containing phosphotransfer) domain-containing protein